MGHGSRKISERFSLATEVLHREIHWRRSDGPRTPALQLPNTCVEFPCTATDSVCCFGHHLNEFGIADVASQHAPDERV